MGVVFGIDERARIQLGLVTRAQALAAGVTRRMIDGKLKAKEWEAVLPGVYRLASAERTAEQQIYAHCLHLGPEAYASHLTAAWLWGLSGCFEPLEVHVTAIRETRTGAEGVVVHSHRGGLPEGFTFRRGVPTTLLTRTLLDLAPVLPLDRPEVVLDSGWRIHRDLFDELDRFLGTLKPRGHAGIGRLAELVALRRGTVPTGSDFETQMLQRVRNAGFVNPVLQFEIYDHQGLVPLERGDLVWPDLKVILMPDGVSFHKTKFQFEKDAATRARLTALGWKYVSVPRGSLDDPAWQWALARLSDPALVGKSAARARPGAPPRSEVASGTTGTAGAAGPRSLCAVSRSEHAARPCAARRPPAALRGSLAAPQARTGTTVTCASTTGVNEPPGRWLASTRSSNADVRRRARAPPSFNARRRGQRAPKGAVRRGP